MTCEGLVGGGGGAGGDYGGGEVGILKAPREYKNHHPVASD
jgi:hypothetical protein